MRIPQLLVLGSLLSTTGAIQIKQTMRDISDPKEMLKAVETQAMVQTQGLVQ